MKQPLFLTGQYYLFLDLIGSKKDRFWSGPQERVGSNLGLHLISKLLRICCVSFDDDRQRPRPDIARQLHIFRMMVRTILVVAKPKEFRVYPEIIDDACNFLALAQ